MAISFGGEFEVKKSAEEVFGFLTDPNRFCPLLPDYQGMSMVDERNFNVKVKVGISHIRGTADVKIHLAQADRPRRAEYQGQGSVAGGTASFRAGFELEPRNGGTCVTWKGEAQIFGKLASVAGGLLEPLAKKNIQKLIDGLQKALG